MSRQVQIRRGTTAEHAAFTGAQGELSYNTTTKRLHSHDGSTVGGAVHALLSEMQTADAAAQAAAEATAAAALAARVATLAGTGGAATVGNLDSAGNYNATDLEGALTEIADTSTYVNLLRFFTPAQIADYQARTAQTNYAGALDLTSAVQTAIYTTYAAGRNLFCPAGAAKITATLEIPTNSALYQDQPDTWEMIGQGVGQGFVQSPTIYKGTVFLANTDITIFRYHQRRVQPTGGGLWTVKRIRFQQNLSTAASTVVVLDNLIDGCEFAFNVIYTAGTGNGVDVTYQIKGEFHHNFISNRNWAAGPAVGTGVGIGVNFPVIVGSGLLSIYKNTVRGFLWGYQVGGAGFNPVCSMLEQNECSMCENGVWVKTGTSNMKLHKPYFEGITGTCVKDDGAQTVVDGGQFYLGFTIGIDGSSGGNLYGNTYINNYLETSGAIPCTLIKVVSGGPTKNIYGNTLLFSTSGGVVPGVVGLDISGSTARINHHSNAYNPRGRWIGGAGTQKIIDTTTAGAYGLGTANDVDQEVPALRRGAMSLALGSAVLTNSDLVGNKLTVGDLSFYQVNGTAATINEISFVNTRHGQRILFETTTGNLMVFTNSALMKLAGAATFTGPGTIEFVCTVSGSTVTAKEVGRTVF